MKNEMAIRLDSLRKMASGGRYSKTFAMHWN
nr:MAG TPA: hypothetical protein [Bacteriophage sp.]DAQ85565.1 MAG TPA: hypothetical protein [Caudoviricetes sp.]